MARLKPCPDEGGLVDPIFFAIICSRLLSVAGRLLRSLFASGRRDGGRIVLAHYEGMRDKPAHEEIRLKAFLWHG
jgi:hypothetical protein